MGAAVISIGFVAAYFLTRVVIRAHQKKRDHSKIEKAIKEVLKIK